MFIYILFITTIFLLMMMHELSQMKIKDSLNIKNNNSKYLENQRFGVYTYTAILLIIMLSASRFNVGWDYMAYYETIVINRITNISLSEEYLTLFLIDLAKILKNAQIYFIINSIITISLIMVNIKKYSKDYWMSIIFFVTFPLFFLNSLSVVRNFTAIAITFYGYKYIKKRQFIKYVLTVIIASLFHKTAMVCIIFYFLAEVKLKKSVTILLLFLTPFLSVILNPLIVRYLPRYSYYTDIAETQQGTKAILILVFILFVSIIFKERLLKESVNFNSQFNIFFTGVFMYLIFAKQGTMGHRLSLYATIYILIILPDIIKIFKIKKDRNLIKIMTYILCILMFFYTINVGRATYIPYQIF